MPDQSNNYNAGYGAGPTITYGSPNLMLPTSDPTIVGGTLGGYGPGNWSDWENYLYNLPYTGGGDEGAVNWSNYGFGGYSPGSLSGGGGSSGGTWGSTGSGSIGVWPAGGGPGATGGGFSTGGVIGGLVGLGALGLAAGGLTNSFGSSNSAQRNLTGEMAGVMGMMPNFSATNLAIQSQVNPALTRLNTSNFNGALKDISGSLRDGYNDANPDLANQSSYLNSLRDMLNTYQPGKVGATGYAAAQAQGGDAGNAANIGFSPASFTSAGQAHTATWDPSRAFTASFNGSNATTANQQTASGGPLLGMLTQNAQQTLSNTKSPLQAQQEAIASGLLGQGGNLSADELRNVQQDTRAAYAGRGLYDSNSAIGSEVLNTDAARRQRLMENIGIAQGVDAAGQNQLNSGRGYALGVQNQGQGLAMFNAGQGNSLNQYNAGLLTSNSQFNAGQQNALGQFNAGLLTNNSQFNSNLGANVNLANAASQNQMAQYNAGQQNAMSQYNAGLGQQAQMYNAGANNQMSQFNAQLGQQNSQYNAGATNQAQQFNAGATNQLGMFNMQTEQNNVNDMWNRSLQNGNFNLQQAINPTAVAMGLIGTAPDYAAPLLGYGSDLYNTNLNASVSATNSQRNNNAALASQGINLLYNLYGRPTGG